MPQVLPEGTGGPRLRVGPGGVSGDALISVALAPAVTSAARRAAERPSSEQTSRYPMPPRLPRLSMGSQVPLAHLGHPAFKGAQALLGRRPGT